MTKYRQLRRRGLPIMSNFQMSILQQLRESKQQGTPFSPLADIHRRTLDSLIEHDWIFESPGLDGVKYSITKRGENALKVYEAPSSRHDDGLCPDCRIRPVHIYGTGRRDGYCTVCKSKRQKRSYRTADYHPQTHICPRCEVRQRHRRSNGRYYAWCKECRAANRFDEREKRKKRDLERTANGEFLPCRRCKIRPRRVFPTYVEDYCAECSREYHYVYRRRREYQKAMES